MFIKNYGLFWHRDEVDWHPGKGTRGAFRLLGRQWKNRPHVRLADFRYQRGIYILYSDHGPHYIGLTTKQGLGKRLRDHLEDEHHNMWTRFSWFGFCRVLQSADDKGIQKLGKLAKAPVGEQDTVIHDVEALLIKAMGLTNKAQARFSEADGWLQIKILEKKSYFVKVQ